MLTKASNVLLLAKVTCGSARSATAAAMNILVIVLILFCAHAQVMPFGGLLILVGGYDLIQLIKTRNEDLTWFGTLLRAYNPGGL